MKNYTLKITLCGSQNPTIWRKVRVPGDMTFAMLHYVIQNVMGWENEHLHEFSDAPYNGKVRISQPSGFGDRLEPGVKEGSKVWVSKYLTRVGARMFYTYDFGDSWLHEIEVEDIKDEEDFALCCIDGAGSCPPEDCGGIGGYEWMKQVFRDDPHGEDAENYREWLGLEDDETLQADTFSIRAADASLTAMRQSYKKQR